jgi:hypothetical protein
VDVQGSTSQPSSCAITRGQAVIASRCSPVVTTAAGRAAARTVVRSALGERGFSGTYTALAAHVPNSAATTSGPFGSITATGMPRRTPAAPRASCSERARSSTSARLWVLVAVETSARPGGMSASNRSDASVTLIAR